MITATADQKDAVISYMQERLRCDRLEAELTELTAIVEQARIDYQNAWRKVRHELQAPAGVYSFGKEGALVPTRGDHRRGLSRRHAVVIGNGDYPGLVEIVE